MARKKAILKKKAKASQLNRILISLLFAILSLLLLVAISVRTSDLIEDFRIMREYMPSVLDYLQFHFPLYTINPIGPFGVIFGYLTVFLFGKFFSYFLLLGIFLASFIHMVKPHDFRYYFRVICGTLFFFFIQLLILTAKRENDFGLGQIPWITMSLLERIFSKTGTIIISLFGSVCFLILALEAATIKNWFISLKNVQISTPATSNGKSKSLPPQAEPVKIQRTESPMDEVTQDIDEAMPNIIDHVLKQIGEEDIEEDATSKATSPVKQKEAIDIEDDREYVKPNINDYLLSQVKLTKRDREETEEAIKNVSRILREKLSEFGIDAEVINVNIGPIITQYELKPAPGVKVSKFLSLADDLALAIKAKSIRVQAPIPGRGLIGIEIPNVNRDMIYLKDILLSDEMKQNDKPLMIGLGKDIAGNPLVADLAKMPHLLIAGATGSGKSVCINTIIVSLLLRTTPSELRMVLIDPKRVELAGYEGIPHLIGEVVTEADDALGTMHWAVREMEKRYEMLQDLTVRDINGYNQKLAEDKTGELKDYSPLPYIILVVDEFADLIMTAGRDIEMPITRLAQMARAVGIHLILATQRPSIKVITGIIKANFPARIAFQVSSKVDSRVILDMMGAERLLGQGDMLFVPPGRATPDRIHGAYVSDVEISKLCTYLKDQPKPKMELMITTAERSGIRKFEFDDELFPEAARVVIAANMASVSMLQRHFKIGYARAGRLIDMLEQAGIIGPHVGSKSREVLATEADLEIYGL
jgi:DNA segregation ATPase FtsK/SpoIIIE, S-DNA-T family